MPESESSLALHYLTDITEDDLQRHLSEGFTCPFRYIPHPLVFKAAKELMHKIDTNGYLSSIFAEGKMLGVLVVKPKNSRHLSYLAAFSGNIDGKSRIEGFVPPIHDLLDPDGHFKKREADISAVNKEINDLSCSNKLQDIKAKLKEYSENQDKEIQEQKNKMKVARKRRQEVRSGICDRDELLRLEKESQFEKAELKRLRSRWSSLIQTIKEEEKKIEEHISFLKKLRAEMSDALQKWIFDRYIVHDKNGNTSPISEIFAERSLRPPGGTGECAAPKLLEYAFRNGMLPIAMGEFWYGRSPETAVRTHGHFYPSCTSKCGPLLEWMLKGTELSHNTAKTNGIPHTIYEDPHIIVIDKPSGMPSVIGLDPRESLQEHLAARYPKIHPVHRLDMDTSGIIIFAKCRESAIRLQRQFEEHSIRKTYLARLIPSDKNATLLDSKGRIELPLSPDYDERPRQKVDFIQGKQAITEYEVLSTEEDGTTYIAFNPVTGRTHQLRVHAAHTSGLSRPIAGDLLYGGTTGTSPDTESRLHLHAYRITIHHPATGKEMTFSSTENCFKIE